MGDANIGPLNSYSMQGLSVDPIYPNYIWLYGERNTCCYTHYTTSGCPSSCKTCKAGDLSTQECKNCQKSTLFRFDIRNWKTVLLGGESAFSPVQVIELCDTAGTPILPHGGNFCVYNNVIYVSDSQNQKESDPENNLKYKNGRHIYTWIVPPLPCSDPRTCGSMVTPTACYDEKQRVCTSVAPGELGCSNNFTKCDTAEGVLNISETGVTTFSPFCLGMPTTDSQRTSCNTNKSCMGTNCTEAEKAEIWDSMGCSSIPPAEKCESYYQLGVKSERGTPLSDAWCKDIGDGTGACTMDLSNMCEDIPPYFVCAADGQSCYQCTDDCTQGQACILQVPYKLLATSRDPISLEGLSTAPDGVTNWTDEAKTYLPHITWLYYDETTETMWAGTFNNSCDGCKNGDGSDKGRYTYGFPMRLGDDGFLESFKREASRLSTPLCCENALLTECDCWCDCWLVQGFVPLGNDKYLFNQSYSDKSCRLQKTDENGKILDIWMAPTGLQAMAVTPAGIISDKAILWNVSESQCSYYNKKWGSADFPYLFGIELETFLS